MCTGAERETDFHEGCTGGGARDGHDWNYKSDVAIHVQYMWAESLLCFEKRLTQDWAGICTEILKRLYHAFLFTFTWTQIMQLLKPEERNDTPVRHRFRTGYKALCLYFISCIHIQLSRSVVQANRLLLGLSLRFSYNHLLFSPTLALPVEGVGVPGVALLELSPNRLPLSGLPP